MGHIRISSEPCGSRTYAYFIFRFVPFSRLTKRKKLYAKRQRTAELGRVFPDKTARTLLSKISVSLDSVVPILSGSAGVADDFSKRPPFC